MGDQPSQSKQADLATKDLELQIKIRQEQLKALQKPAYRKPKVLFGAITAAVALLGLVGDNLKQRFSAARSELSALTAEDKTTELDKQVKALETRKSELEGEKTKLQDDVERQRKEIAASERQLQEMKEEEAKMAAELNAKQLELDAAAAEYAKLTQMIEELKPKVAESEPDLHESFSVIQADIRKARGALPKADLNACALSESGLFVAVGQAGAIVISPGRGKNWRSPERVVEGHLSDVACSADGKVIVAAGSGAILVSRDAGQSWTVTKDQALGWRVACSTDGKYLWVGGRWLYHSNDSGAHWNRASSREFFPDGLLALERGRVLVASLVGSEKRYEGWIYRSEDLDSPSGPHDVPVRGVMSVDALTAATPTAFWIAGWDEERGVGQLLCSVDEGKTWGSLPAVGVPHIRSLWVSPNQRNLAAVTADGRWAISDNAGNHWNYQSRDSRDTMTDITGSADGGLLCCVGKKGVILWSSDGGQSWTRPTYPRPGMRSSD